MHDDEYQDEYWDEYWEVYLAGEIHSDWREQILDLAVDLPVIFTGPICDHDASDRVGVKILGPENNPFWRDHRSAKINAICTLHHLSRADLVVVRFGDTYRQWNAAFDAGWAVAKEIPLITMHDASLDHALKEVDAHAKAVCRGPEQVVEIIRYVTGHS